MFFPWLIILACTALIFVVDFRSQAKPQAKNESAGMALDLASRYVVGVKTFMHSVLDSNSATSQSLATEIDAAAKSPADHLRAIAVDGELEGAKKALRRIDAFSRQNDDTALARDAATFGAIYDHGADSVAPTEIDRLITRYGWYADLAISHDRPDTDPIRQRALNPAKRTLIAIAVGVTLGLLALAAGIGLLIYLAVTWNQFFPAARYDPASGPILLQGFAVYLLSMTIFMVTARSLPAGINFAWNGLLIIPIILAFVWVRLQGVEWTQLRQDIGWTTGQGIIREMASGIAGYITGIPVIVVSILVVAILTKLTHSTATHPIAKEIQQHGAMRFFVFFLACIFAPITEETMFRGLLLAHLRTGHRWLASALLVSLLFAAIHPQGWVAIPALGAIAMTLAAIRERRGSLIGSMTAHALNNFSVLVFVVAAAG